MKKKKLKVSLLAQKGSEGWMTKEMGSGEEKGKVQGREGEREGEREGGSMVRFPVRQSPTADMEGIAGNQAVERGLMQLMFSWFITSLCSLWHLKRNFFQNNVVFSSLFTTT